MSAVFLNLAIPMIVRRVAEKRGASSREVPLMMAFARGKP